MDENRNETRPTDFKQSSHDARNRVSEIDANPQAMLQKLEHVNEDLKAVADEFSLKLTSVLKHNEDLTRETYLTQVEIQRATALKETLTRDIEDHRNQLASFKQENSEIQEKFDSLRNRVSELKNEREELLGEKDALETMVRDLEQECGTLGDENQKLKDRKEKITREVQSLRKIREEYLSQIAKFKELKDEMLM